MACSIPGNGQSLKGYPKIKLKSKVLTMETGRRCQAEKKFRSPPHINTTWLARRTLGILRTEKKIKTLATGPTSNQLSSQSGSKICEQVKQANAAERGVFVECTYGYVIHSRPEKFSMDLKDKCTRYKVLNVKNNCVLGFQIVFERPVFRWSIIVCVLAQTSADSVSPSSR
ncbi:hypothetical protein CBL_05961 [Carabus blaptoides fortunei]